MNSDWLKDLSRGKRTLLSDKKFTKKDAEDVLKEKTEAWLKEPTTQPEHTDETYVPRLVRKRQQIEIEYENRNCCRTFSTIKQML